MSERGSNMISTWEGILWFIGGILLGLILSDPKKYFDY